MKLVQLEQMLLLAHNVGISRAGHGVDWREAQIELIEVQQRTEVGGDVKVRRLGRRPQRCVVVHGDHAALQRD